MKDNYSIKCEKILNELDGKKKLLLHSCCGPCSSYVISYLTKYFDITVFYYNPNIYNYDKYDIVYKRNMLMYEGQSMDTYYLVYSYYDIEDGKLINEIDKVNSVNIVDCDYDNDYYNTLIKGLENEPERGNRCKICYLMRMEKTASTASENDFDFFCTTLSVSPYKNSMWINEFGELLEKKYNVRWLYSDFKKRDGYKTSISLSNKYNLYRQNYCGCIYSKPQ